MQQLWKGDLFLKMGYFYKNFSRKLLFSFEPEFIHDLTVKTCRILQKSEFINNLIQKIFDSKPHLTEVAGLKFRNPVGLAAGFDKNCEIFKILSNLGFGFLELGTVTLRPQTGNPKPRLFRIPGCNALINRMGLNNAGVLKVEENLKKIGPIKIPLGINIGKNTNTPIEKASFEYLSVIRILYPYGNFFVLNISCPNVDDLSLLHKPKHLINLIEPILKFLQDNGQKPVFIKVSPDLTEHDLRNLVNISVEYGVGLVATNTTIDKSSLPDKWKNEKGGLSGRPLMERSNQVITQIREMSKKIPIIGVGGIFSGQDVMQKLKLGANLVEVYTGLIYDGPFLVKEILKEISFLLEDENGKYQTNFCS